MNSPTQCGRPKQLEFKSLLDNAILSNAYSDRPCCLISSEPLGKQSLTLSCGHSFNYTSIYEEVKRQKLHRFTYETPRLGDNQIKCPYCQKVHDYLLPPCRGFPPQNRINSPIKWSLESHTCEHVFCRGKNQGRQCTIAALCGENRCLRHATKTVSE